MQVILAETIPNLGEQGQIVKVKPGYARNYLIPKGFAHAVHSADAANISHKQRMVMDQQRRRIKTEQDMAHHLNTTSVQIPVRVGEEDRIFGTVTSQHICEALAAKGFNVDRRKIVLDEPIRALGVYTVPVRFSGDTKTDLKVWVVKAE